MTEIQCKNCNEQVEVNFYFYEESIIKTEFFPSDTPAYAAIAKCRAICPSCGGTIEHYFHHSISSMNIITLAQGGKVVL